MSSIEDALKQAKVGTEAPMKDEDALIPPSVDGDSSVLVEVTTYIREDQACALEMIQIGEQLARGAPCDQAELFQEALDLLIKARMLVIDKRARKMGKNDKALEPG
jgi:hypothetical protein